MAIGTSKVGALGGLVPGGSETFNTSGTFCVPPGVKTVSITGVGSPGNPGTAGNPGNPGNPGYGSAGGGGGGGSVPLGPQWCYAVFSGLNNERGGVAGTTALLNTVIIGTTFRDNPIYGLSGGNAGNHGNRNAPGAGGAGNAGQSGQAGSAGSAGSCGSAGNQGQASSGLSYNFDGGAGGNAGTAGNAGNAGAGATGGSGGAGAPNNTYGNGGAGGQFGGTGGIGQNSYKTNNFSNGAFYVSGGGGGGGAGTVNSGGTALTSTLNGPVNPCQQPAILSPSNNQQKTGGQGGNGNTIAQVSPTQHLTVGYGGPGKQSWPANLGTDYNNNYTYSPFPFSPVNVPARNIWGFNVSTNNCRRLAQGVCAGPAYGGNVGNILRCCSRPTSHWVNGPACDRANILRSGAGGGAGLYGLGNTPSCFVTPVTNQYQLRSGGGGGGGGRGVTGGTGGAGGAGGCGAAATPATYNCVPVTPGGSYPIVVNACGQVTISWNPQ